MIMMNIAISTHPTSNCHSNTGFITQTLLKPKYICSVVESGPNLFI